MIPNLNGIDHVHVYVSNWSDAEAWYGKVLGFRRMGKLVSWAVKGGPLTLEDPSGKVHLALFEAEKSSASTVAFGTSGVEFLAWKTHLESHGIDLRVSDHMLAWSMYFKDPFNNLYEITTYDCEEVAKYLSP